MHQARVVGIDPPHARDSVLIVLIERHLHGGGRMLVLLEEPLELLRILTSLRELNNPLVLRVEPVLARTAQVLLAISPSAARATVLGSIVAAGVVGEPVVVVTV